MERTGAGSDVPSALDVAEPLLSHVSLGVLNASVALRAYSPTVELHRQLASESSSVCGSGDAASGRAWAVVWARDVASEAAVAEDGDSEPTVAAQAVVACTPAQLEAAVASGGVPTGAAAGLSTAPAPQVFAFDHVYPQPESGEESYTATVLVHGTLGTRALAAMHAAAVRASSEAQARYVLRHVVPTHGGDAGEATFLRGYGVMLDIKNMEYKALDDRPPQVRRAPTGHACTCVRLLPACGVCCTQ